MSFGKIAATHGRCSFERVHLQMLNSKSIAIRKANKKVISIHILFDYWRACA